MSVTATNWMSAMVTSQTAMKQATAQRSVQTRLDGHAGVLESEIKQDKALGGDTKKKEEELADTEERSNDLTAAQGQTLSEATKAMKEAREADLAEARAEKKKEARDAEKARLAERIEAKKANTAKAALSDTDGNASTGDAGVKEEMKSDVYKLRVHVDERV